MTSLRRQLDNVLARLLAIRDMLQNSHEYPPCCLTFHKNNQISCDTLGPMSEEAFMQCCKECKKTMEELLDHVSQSLQ